MFKAGFTNDKEVTLYAIKEIFFHLQSRVPADLTTAFKAKLPSFRIKRLYMLTSLQDTCQRLNPIRD